MAKILSERKPPEQYRCDFCHFTAPEPAWDYGANRHGDYHCCPECGLVYYDHDGGFGTLRQDTWHINLVPIPVCLTPQQRHTLILVAMPCMMIAKKSILAKLDLGYPRTYFDTDLAHLVETDRVQEYVFEIYRKLVPDGRVN